MMKKNSRIAGLMAAVSLVMLLFPVSATSASETVLFAQDSCYAAGQDYAASSGATLVAAEAAVKDGQNVCKVVVLHGATNGNRPRRETVYLPR